MVAGAAEESIELGARRPSAIDLFSGAGGMSLGFEQAGFDVLVAVDNDPVHLAVHERNFPLTATLCTDAAELSSRALLEAAGRARALLPEKDTSSEVSIDCLFGGPSCQGFSSIGRRDPQDPRNSLLDEFARIVEEVQPRSFVMENVPGLVAPNFIEILRSLRRRLASAGYAIVGNDDVLELDAANFGIPQRRKRVFLVGIRDGAMPPTLPPTEITPRVTVADALDDLPNADDHEDLLSGDSVKLEPGDLVALINRASPYALHLRQPALGLGRPRSWDPSLLTSSARTQHSQAVRKRYADTPEGSEEIVSRNPRLRGDGQSTTLRAGTGRDHGSFSAARPIHHQYPRVITVREAARLHSFPDWFRFHVTKWHGFRQVGNAVPPFLAWAVADSVRQSLGVHPPVPSKAVSLRDDELLELSLVEAADHFGYDRERLPRDSRLRAGADKATTKRASA